MFLKVSMVILFFVVSLGIGVYCKRHASDVNGFVLGGRSVGPWLSAFAYGTSYFSAVIFIGYAGQFGWKYGISATWIGLGNALIGSLLAWIVLGRRTRIMSQSLDAVTMPDFFGKRFHSKNLKIAAALIIFIFLIPYTASVYNGLSRLFEMAFHIDYTYCILGMALLTAIYVIIGGYMATAVLKLNGGFMGSLIGLSQIPMDNGTTELQGAFASFFGPDPLNLLGVIILTSLGTWGLPQMVQKFYAIKSEKDVHIGTIVSTAFALIVAGGSYFLGGFGRLFGDDVAYNATTGLPIYDSIIPSMLSFLPNILIAIVVMLVLSASMSTLSSLVLTSSSVITLDLINQTLVKDMDEKKKVFIMRLFLIFFITLSALIALVQYHSSVTFIAQLMSISWGALAGAFLGPFVFSLYSKKVTKIAVWCSFICGVGFTTGNMILSMLGTPIIQSPINAGALTMVLSLVIVPLVSWITPKLPAKFTDEIFACFDEKILTSRKNSLED